MYKYYIWIAIWVVVIWVGWFFWRREYNSYLSDQFWHGAWGEPSLQDLLWQAATDLQSNKTAYISCLQKKWVTFYWWASCWYSCADVQKYGNDMKSFTCVDCDLNSSVCEQLWVKDLPARAWEWKIVQDITSLQDLAVEFGCNS